MKGVSMTSRLVSRRAFVPLAALAVAGLAFAMPAVAAGPSAPGDANLNVWVVTASHDDAADAGRTVPPELASWGELASDPLRSFTRFDVVDHVTVPLAKDKPFRYAIKGESSEYEITLLGIDEPPKTRAREYVYRIAFPSPEKKRESLQRVTKPGERTIIRDRGFKGSKSQVRFIAVSVGP